MKKILLITIFLFFATNVFSQYTLEQVGNIGQGVNSLWYDGQRMFGVNDSNLFAFTYDGQVVNMHIQEGAGGLDVVGDGQYIYVLNYSNRIVQAYQYNQFDFSFTLKGQKTFSNTYPEGIATDGSHVFIGERSWSQGGGLGAYDFNGTSFNLIQRVTDNAYYTRMQYKNGFLFSSGGYPWLILKYDFNGTDFNLLAKDGNYPTAIWDKSLFVDDSYVYLTRGGINGGSTNLYDIVMYDYNLNEINTYNFLTSGEDFVALWSNNTYLFTSSYRGISPNADNFQVYDINSSGLFLNQSMQFPSVGSYSGGDAMNSDGIYIYHGDTIWKFFEIPITGGGGGTGTGQGTNDFIVTGGAGQTGDITVYYFPCSPTEVELLIDNNTNIPLNINVSANIPAQNGVSFQTDFDGRLAPGQQKFVSVVFLFTKKFDGNNIELTFSDGSTRIVKKIYFKEQRFSGGVLVAHNAVSTPVAENVFVWEIVVTLFSLWLFYSVIVSKDLIAFISAFGGIILIIFLL